MIKHKVSAACSWVVDGLTVSYGQVPALWDVSFAIPKACLCAIIGPNGAGKSTLLKAAFGFTKSHSGNVAFLGKPLQMARSYLAYVPQRESVDWNFPINVRELVLMGRYPSLGLFRKARKVDYEAADYYIELLGLKEFAMRQINQLSGGQQQRAFLARSLLQEAKIYFLDEPFAGIDIASTEMILKTLKVLVEKECSVFVVHHDLNSVASFFDWAILINLRLVACGKVEEVLTRERIELAYGKSCSLFEKAFQKTTFLGGT